MPAFMLAGFFAALLMEKRHGHLVKNRAQRILIPLILFCFYSGQSIDSPGRPKVVMLDESNATPLLEILRNNLNWDHLPIIGDTAPHTMHLWFIHYLVIFYFVSIPVIHSVKSKIPSAADCLNRSLDFVFSTRAKVLIIPTLILLSFLTLKNEGSFHFNVSFDFLPGIPFLLNFRFFVAGWIMYARRDVIEASRNGSFTLLPLFF